jgi:hypothetical protein
VFGGVVKLRVLFLFVQLFVCSVHAEGVKVVELFTSQSCSSCPPADEALSQLSNMPNVIALGYHVTYWDHLSWEDTFSLEAATARQASYQVKRDMAGVFTPEMIVNGRVSFTGSDINRLKTELASAKELPQIGVEKKGEELTIVLPARGDKDGSSNLVLVAIGESERVIIKRGENSGRAVTYDNVVIGIEQVKNIAGGKAQLPTKLLSLPKVKKIVVLLSDGEVSAGAIEAAGVLSL